MESLEIGNHGMNGNGAEPNGDRPPEATTSEPAAKELGRLPALVESLLFAAAAPVTLGRLVEALDGPTRAEVLRAIERLAASYEREGRGLRLTQVAGGYQLRTPPEHAPWVRRLLQERPPRLSRPMLETVAIVAYRQPCRRLVRVVGRKDAPGRPLLYGTTREFLEVFGLPDLSALPTLRELGEGAELLGAPDLTVGSSGVEPTPDASASPPTAAGDG
jgi:segregation and condensation protein B